MGLHAASYLMRSSQQEKNNPMSHGFLGSLLGLLYYGAACHDLNLNENTSIVVCSIPIVTNFLSAGYEIIRKKN